MTDLPATPPIFDGHNDLLLRLWRAAPEDRDRLWLRGNGRGHLDLPRMRAGGFAGGFFAIYIPSPMPGGLDIDAMMDNPPYDLALPDPVPVQTAQPIALAMAGILRRMERVSDGAFRVCLTAGEVERCLAGGVIAAITHMEGAEAIGPDLDALHVFHAAGLRSLGPVWSRPTIFGHGVPFRFPGDPDTGDGLTPLGRDLVRLCGELRVLVDLSHLNAKGFDDVAALSDAPLVATHSCAHAVSPSTRNLTDRQLDMIRERDGMVGLNFATCFLRPDGRRGADIGWEPILRHLDHLIGRLGEDKVGFGSDFDGAMVPDGIRDVAGLPALRAALAGHGYDAALIERLCHGNWIRVLRATLGA
ncbi:dipeptidase [Amaricoccus solimangrovi]|uniref:Membrane dipeptidase n=1 Tax=Amaricoccus solimangrovi TaxID=2589815 RepID=A0A501WXL5_9RHOB|nr:dipeptidase [Amaricoccus solimangrovi]TPE52985.1 membrane dipeptidase [Amaricoccus solimangrovi]